MPLTFTQVSTEIQANAVTSVGKVYPGSTTLGSLLIAHGLVTSAATMTVTDSIGNTWSPLGSIDSTYPAQVFYAVNVGSGANTVTLHTSTTDNLFLFVLEYTGQVAGANPFDAVNGLSQWHETGTTTVPFGSVTTASSNETLIFLGRNDGGGTAFTSQDGSIVRAGGATGILLQDRFAAPIGTYSSAFSTSQSGAQGTGIFMAVKTPASATAGNKLGLAPFNVSWLAW